MAVEALVDTRVVVVNGAAGWKEHPGRAHRRRVGWCA
jgi:hypothetical protein